MLGYDTVRTWGKAAIALPFLLAVAAGAAQAAPERVELEPSTPWHVDWQENSCTLRRGFSPTDAPTILQFERFSPGDEFQLLLSSPVFRSVRQGEKLIIHYGTNGYSHTPDNVLVSDSVDGVRTIFVTSSALNTRRTYEDDQDPVSPAMEAAVTEISVSKVRGKQIVLKTGWLDKAFAALRECTDQLVEEWGLDPEVQRTLSSPVEPLNDLGSLVTGADYPTNALMRGSQAIISVIVLVDVHGQPTRCEIQRTYQRYSFGEVTCGLMMKRARFKPALDAAGKPVSSYFHANFIWVIR